MADKNYEDVFQKINRKVIFEILLMVIVFVIFQALIYKHQAIRVKREIDFIGNTLVNELEKNISINSSVLIALGYNYNIDSNITKDKFDRLCQYYIQKFPYILYLQHKNKDTVTDMVYPLEGNEETLGKSLRNRPEAKDATDKAIKNKEITANNPYELKFLNYKTIGLIKRYPIFHDNEFDGFFVSVVDLNKFLDDIIKEDIRKKYDISISDSTSKEFYKTGTGRGDYIYKNKIHIEDNHWTIAIGLKSSDKRKIMIYMVSASLLLGLIFIALFYMKYKLLAKNRDINELTMLKDELRQEIENRNTVEEDLSKLAAIIESSSDAILGLSLNGDIITWNAGAERMYGYKEEEVKGRNISLIIPEKKRPEIFNALDRVRWGEIIGYFETERSRKNGEEIYVSTTISLVRDRNGKIIGFSEIAKDITEHKIMEQSLCNSYEELSAVYQQLAATEEELRLKFDELQKNDELLRKSEQRYELVISASSDGIYDWDIKNNEMYHSKSWKTMIDYEENELVDSIETWKKHIHPDDKGRVLAALDKFLNREINDFRIEYRFRKKDCSYIWIQDRGIAVWDENNKPVRMVGTMKNIDERKKWEEKIYNMAYYDPLTDLPNRILFEEKLNYALKNCDDNSQKGAVFFIDLDNFKNINDTLGHEFGDELIEKVGRDLQSSVGEHDIVTRFGGDEFLIMQSAINGFRDSIELADRILNIFNDPWIVGEHQIYITASVGIAIFPDDGVDANEILKNADTAMYKAKASGKNRYQFFQKLMSDEILRKTEIGNALRDALKNNEFELYYQPLIDLKTGKIISFEALIRWKHPDWGFVSPNEFIPIAEETGLIIPIGEWVLKNACKQNKEWKDKGYIYDFIAVNVSSVQLQQRNFINNIKEILNEYNLKPQFLELEITESVLMKYIDWNIKTLNQLKNMGVKVAIDDFGTGYSSLNYLKNLPIDSIKVDKSFIDGICLNANGESIVEGIILLAHKMNLEVVAEGVEKKEQLNILREKQCDKIQGYYISKPLQAKEIEELIKREYFDLV